MLKKDDRCMTSNYKSIDGDVIDVRAAANKSGSTLSAVYSHR
jgi:hypothetical protein